MGHQPAGEWYEAAVRNGLIPAAAPAPQKAPTKPVKATPQQDLELVLWAVGQSGFTGEEREYRFHATRKWRFDIAWPQLKVALEREGSAWVNGRLVSRHRSDKGYAADCEKYNAAQVAGWMVVRATPVMLGDGRALAALLEALSARSGPPPPQ